MGFSEHARPSSVVRQPISAPALQEKPAAPALKRLANGHFRLRKPWTVNLNGRRWHVPAGYSTNGITGPSWLQSALGNGIQRPETWAAVFHDWLFTQPGISRTEADQIFHELLIAYEVSPMKARLMHSGVAAYSASKSFR